MSVQAIERKLNEVLQRYIKSLKLPGVPATKQGIEGIMHILKEEGLEVKLVHYMVPADRCPQGAPKCRQTGLKNVEAHAAIEINGVVAVIHT
jgi:hypothetical protein